MNLSSISHVVFGESAPSLEVVTIIANLFGGEGSLLLVTGKDADGIQRAAADLLYRYWRHAKDAVSFREGMPPVEGEGIAEEPTGPAVAAGAVALEGPASVPPGEAFRVVALDQAEPPAAIPGVLLTVWQDGAEVASARTDGSGEATFRLEAAGSYEIRAEGAGGQSLRITVRSRSSSTG